MGIGVAADPFEDIAWELMGGLKELLESDVPVEREDIHIKYCIGPGYAVPSPEGCAAVRRLAGRRASWRTRCTPARPWRGSSSSWRRGTSAATRTSSLFTPAARGPCSPWI